MNATSPADPQDQGRLKDDELPLFSCCHNNGCTGRILCNVVRIGFIAGSLSRIKEYAGGERLGPRCVITLKESCGPEGKLCWTNKRKKRKFILNLGLTG